MSVSGNLRMELGDYIKFDPSMLPKTVLNRDFQKNNYVTNVIKLPDRTNPIPETKEQNVENIQPQITLSEEKTEKFANSFGMNPEEFIQMFNVVQEAKVKELAEMLNADNITDENFAQNPFSNE